MGRRPVLLVFAVVVAACGGGSEPGGPDAPSVAIGTDTTVVAFEGEHVYFAGADNRRQASKEVTFPARAQRYSRVTLRLGLRCPSGGCDWWDRLAHLSLVVPGPGPNGEIETELELARFITPYRVGGQFTVDVTDFQRELEATRVVRVFIDTWVGPGHANGSGWLVDASFEFTGGMPVPDPVAVRPLWAPRRLVYGHPERIIDPVDTVQLPEGLSATRVRALVTGHGQGNAENCAEFCAKDHAITVDQTRTVQRLWRDDCATTAVPNQQGTWRYARAGWCPGAMVTPWIVDAVGEAGTHTVAYSVQNYENTCRPDAASCGGCTLGTGCDYDGGAHTEPGWEFSAVLIELK